MSVSPSVHRMLILESRLKKLNKKNLNYARGIQKNVVTWAVACWVVRRLCFYTKASISILCVLQYTHIRWYYYTLCMYILSVCLAVVGSGGLSCQVHFSVWLSFEGSWNSSTLSFILLHKMKDKSNLLPLLSPTPRNARSIVTLHTWFLFLNM